jgi:hypothetical protein
LLKVAGDNTVNHLGVNKCVTANAQGFQEKRYSGGAQKRFDYWTKLASNAGLLSRADRRTDRAALELSFPSVKH